MSKDLYYVLALVLLVSIGAAIKYLLDKANVKLSSPILWAIYVIGFVLILKHTNDFEIYIGFALLLFSGALLVHRFYRFIHGKTESSAIPKKEQISYCTQCGYKLSQTDTYCARCGNRTKVDPKTISKNFDSTQAIASKTFSSEGKKFLLGTKKKVISIEEAKKHTKNAKKEGLGLKALSIAGWVVGAAVGKYSGINLLIPLFATGVVFWASTKLLRAEKKVIIPALSVNAGHFLWLGLGVALTGDLNANAVDLLVYAIGLLLLVIKPSAGPLYLLSAYQALSLVVNAVAFADAAVGNSDHKALLVHLIWRAVALFLMVKLFLALRQKASPGDIVAP